MLKNQKAKVSIPFNHLPPSLFSKSGWDDAVNKMSIFNMEQFIESMNFTDYIQDKNDDAEMFLMLCVIAVYASKKHRIFLGDLLQEITDEYEKRHTFSDMDDNSI